MHLRFPSWASYAAAFALSCGGSTAAPASADQGDAHDEVPGSDGGAGNDSRSGNESGPDNDAHADDAALPSDSGVVVPGLATPASSECQIDGDCAPQGKNPVHCTEVVPGGYRACIAQTPVATGPLATAVDECDAQRPCAAGTCYPVSTYPSGQCGLGGGSGKNACRQDECTSDSDCQQGQICGPAGLSSSADSSGGFFRQCLAASCRLSSDCNELPGGVCALMPSGCERRATTVSTRADFRAARLVCVYPEGCLRAADCPTGSSCTVRGTHPVCVAQ
jgi:hypothetical protein